jgi:integrase
LAVGDLAEAKEEINCAMECLAESIERYTKVPDGLEIVPSQHSAIAMSCENGIIMDGNKDLRCRAGKCLSDAGGCHCDTCHFAISNGGDECDPEHGYILLENDMTYDATGDGEEREGSRKTYATAANTIRSSSLAKTKIQKLTTSSIKRLFISLYEQDMSKNYINLVHIVLKNSLQMAFEDGCLVKNPSAFKLSSVLPEIKSSPPVALKKQVKDNLLLMLEKSKNPKGKFYFHVVRILCETGLRIGEFRGLRPSAISFEDTEISIHHQLSRQGTYDVPKTEHAIRKVPLTDNAATSLRYLVDRAEKIRQKTGSLEYAGCSDFIAISEKGIPVDYFAYARAFVRFEKEYQEKYGEPIEVTPHICRHTFSSNCVAGGLPHKSLQQLMGHSNFQMTMNVYTNLEDSVVREDFFRAASAL